MKKAYWVGIVDVKNHDEYANYTEIAGPALVSCRCKNFKQGWKNY